MKKQNILIITLLSLMYLIVNILYWYINSPIYPVDNASELFKDIFSNSFWYFNGPLITWIFKLMIMLFGLKYIDLQLIIINYFFFVLALCFVYKLGKELKNEKVGIIATILFSLTPAVYLMSRRFGHQDWHIMVATTVSVYFLIKTDYFKNRLYSIFYAISISFGLLIKDSFVLYFIAPYVYIILKTTINKINLNKIINILMTIIIPVLITGYHYFVNKGMYKVFREAIIDPAPIFSSDNLFPLTVNLWDTILSLPIFLLFMISLVWFIAYYKKIYKSTNINIIFLWFFVPYFTLMFIKQCARIHHILPIVPPIIFIVSIFLSNLKNKLLKKFIISITMIVLLSQYIIFSFPLSRISKLFDNYVSIFGLEIMYYDNNNLFIKHGDENLQRFINYLNDKYTNQNKIILFYFGYKPYNIGLINSYLLFNGFKTDAKQQAEDNDYKILKNFDIVMLLTSGLETEEEFANSLTQMQIVGNYISKEYIENFRKQSLTNIRNIFKSIREDYCIIDKMYIYQEDKEYEIVLFGKKDKYKELENVDYKVF